MIWPILYSFKKKSSVVTVGYRNRLSIASRISLEHKT